MRFLNVKADDSGVSGSVSLCCSASQCSLVLNTCHEHVGTTHKAKGLSPTYISSDSRQWYVTNGCVLLDVIFLLLQKHNGSITERKKKRLNVFLLSFLGPWHVSN